MHPLVRVNDELPSTLAEDWKWTGKKEKMWEQVAKIMTEEFHVMFNLCRENNKTGKNSR